MCRWRAGPKSSAICPTASPRVRGRTRRRLPCNRHDLLRTCRCVKAFRCNMGRPAHFHSEGGRLRRRGRSELGWGVFPHSRAAPELAERSFIQISDVHLDVRLLWQWGNETARSSAASPTRPRSAAAKLRRYVVLAVPLHQRTWLTASYIGHLDAMATCTDRSRQRRHHHRQLQRLPARGRRGPTDPPPGPRSRCHRCPRLRMGRIGLCRDRRCIDSPSCPNRL